MENARSSANVVSRSLPHRSRGPSRHCGHWRGLASTALALSLLSACATPPPPECPAGKAAPTTAPPAPKAPPGPTAEEIEEKKVQVRLTNDYHKLSSSARAEIARLTPELRVAAAALAAKSYWSAKAAVSAALQGSHRQPGNSARDAVRHPLKTLEFFGFKPNQVVLEYGPGAGWYTEILAPALAKRGKLSLTLSDPNGPRDNRETYYATRTQVFLQLLQEAYGKVTPAIVDSKSPKLAAEDSSIDLAFVSRGMHGMLNRQVLGSWLSEFHRTLKPGGVLAVIQHRAPKGAEPIASSKNGYLPEAFVVEIVTRAGFKLEASSEINANPQDTGNHTDGVWSLPPTLRGGDVDKAKFVAIGESDRMTLKFVKIDLPKAAAPKAVAPKAVTPKAVTPKAVTPKAVTPKAVTPKAVAH